MHPTFFKTPSLFRKWLEKNHLKKKELVVGYYKKDSGKKSITWPESVQEALCFGWIDGIRRSVDEESYSIRFTPRNPKSIWSAVNLKLMEGLITKGLVSEQGLKLYNLRDEKKQTIYSYERENAGFTIEYIKLFKANKKAYKWFEMAAPYYKKLATHWVMSAKHEATQKKRLSELINDSEQGQKIKAFRPLSKK